MTDTAAADTGTTSTSAALGDPGAAPATTASPAGDNRPGWLPETATPEQVGYVQNKGWDDPVKMLDSYQNLEKLRNVPGERLLQIPGEDDAEGWNEVFSKLGRPADAAEYKIDVPDGSPAEYADGFRSRAHELGLTAKQVEGLAQWNNEFAGQFAEQRTQQTAAQFEADSTALKQEWGAAFDDKLMAARAVREKLGWDDATVDKLSSALGHKATLQLLADLGEKTGEADFVSGRTPSATGKLTPDQAKSEIKALQQDKVFTAKLMNKDADALKRWTRLHQFAAGEG